MSQSSFVLVPFPIDTEKPTDLSLTGTINRQSSILTMSYCLQGQLAAISISIPEPYPTRQHNLWQTTCFEFFLGIPSRDHYWEFNLSPAGHWNAYRFDGYRQGMQEELAFTTLPFQVELGTDRLSLVIALDLAAIVPVDHPLEVAITAVIQTQTDVITYWALTHPGTDADFHRRDSFVLAI
ncbi:MAG: DOMON-like domain-containing protein [Scytolyngbya sp. HA4215-MV1]|jgi:hypothetical protein|nr:DOMON-like domain-containing protein [Scytolyngbya sp. HA4215-MV1]